MKIPVYKSLAIIIVMVIAGVTSAGAAPVSAIVQKTEGSVMTQASAGAEWVSVAVGDTVSTGASLRTGPESSCSLKWGNGNVIKIQPMSLMNVAMLENEADGTEKSRFDLSSGRINAHVAKLMTTEAAFNVKTPTAIAGVRGTELFVNIAEDKTTTFGVTEGEIFVEAGGVETVVLQDFYVTVSPVGAVAPPIVMPVEMKQEAVEQIKSAKQEIKQEEKETPKGKEKVEVKKDADSQEKDKDKEKNSDTGKSDAKQEEKSSTASSSATSEKSSETTQSEKSDTQTSETETTQSDQKTEEADTRTAATEAPAAVEADAHVEAEPEPTVEVTADISDIPVEIDTAAVIDNVLEEQLNNEITTAAEEVYKTGQFEMDIYIEP